MCVSYEAFLTPPHEAPAAHQHAGCAHMPEGVRTLLDALAWGMLPTDVTSWYRMLSGGLRCIKEEELLHSTHGSSFFLFFPPPHIAESLRIDSGILIFLCC